MRTLSSLTFICLCIAMAKVTTAQDLPFDLKNYKTTDYKRQSLDVTFSTQNSSKSEDIFDTEQKTSNLESLVKFNPSYKRVSVSREKVQNDFINMDFKNDYYSLKTKNEISSRKNKSESLDFGINAGSSIEKYYSTSSKRFFKYGGSVGFGDEYSSSKSASDTVTYKSNIIPLSAQLTLGHGHGRLENIEDAVEALYILNELKEKGITMKTISEEDIKQFADCITKIKQERFFDERLYRQKSMAELVSKLLELGLIDNESISTFNTIADYHYYAGFNPRYSGNVLKYYANTFIRYSFYSSEPIGSPIRTLSNWVTFNIEYNSEIPISLKWQKSLTLNARYSFFDGSSMYIINGNGWKEFDTDPSQAYYAYAGYSISYLPNTRTSMVATGYGHFNYLDQYESPDLYIGLSGRVNYYISERLKFNIDLQLYYYDKNSISPNGMMFLKSNGINSNLNAGFTYSLF